ncbi:heat shock protein belonging to the HSP70 family [Reticulomyxa filosa]|uniref:Heat shock protein belonging to the HSP70 family n=1 Tax=Reticulomyxa filosa TaxID=46433 RepID=X6M3K2_RETFI|nr:heat shock protein belonging to the HSP70 family [Reticulomyxa filosa]|eukprot:ETO08504.1 heat shock protein belonging to the HSP70 family [Reticulomyxa filosa]
MSVVGIDVGSQFSKVAVAFQKKISMIPNDQSKFETSTLVGYSEKQREIGEAAETTFNRNYKNTVCQVKRFLGRHADDPMLAQELHKWNYCKVSNTEDGKVAFDVATSEGPQKLASEQVLCAFLRQLKEVWIFLKKKGEKGGMQKMSFKKCLQIRIKKKKNKFTSKHLQGLPVKDCVITCPVYFTDAQRRSIMAAATLAELNVLRLLNETTAIAVSYGLFRKVEENRRVMFVDMGYSNTQVCIVDFEPNQLEMYATSSDAYLGARDFDFVLFEHFRKQFETTHRVDISQDARARLRLMKGVERVKKILTGNKDAVFMLECLANDIDFNLRITRDEFDSLCTPLLAKLSECVGKAVAEMRARDNKKLNAANDANQSATATPKKKILPINSVEITGGAGRIRCVQDGLVTILKQHIPECQIDKCCTTLNGDESVARGAALVCAMLSPVFKVREFQVQDINHWPVLMSYPGASSLATTDGNTSTTTTSGNITRQLVLQRYAPCPCTAKITFHKKESFDVKFEHPQEDSKLEDSEPLKLGYPMKCELGIGDFKIEMVELTPNSVKDPQIKLMLSLNRHGLLEMPQAELIEFINKEPEVKPQTPTDPKSFVRVDQGRG